MARSPEFYQEKEGSSYWKWVGYSLAAVVILGIAAEAIGPIPPEFQPKLPVITAG